MVLGFGLRMTAPRRYAIICSWQIFWGQGFASCEFNQIWGCNMDRNKPLLSVLFFIGLSFWGIQTPQAAASQTFQNSAEFLNIAAPDMPGLVGTQSVTQLQLPGYGATLFSQAKLSVAGAIRRGVVTVKAIYEIIAHSFFVNLLESMFQPATEKTNLPDLKAVLPATAWIFLSVVLGVLGLKKRNASLNTDFY